MTIFATMSIVEIWGAFMIWLEAWLPTIIPTAAAILPSLGALFGILVSCVKLIKDNKAQIKPILEQFAELRQEVKDKTDLREARQEMKQIIHDNAVLKRQMNELITAQTKVKHEVPENETKR